MRTWDDVEAEIRALGDLEDDWDGEGSPAPSQEYVEQALLVIAAMRKEGRDVPDRCLASVNGGIAVEWRMKEPIDIASLYFDATSFRLQQGTP